MNACPHQQRGAVQAKVGGQQALTTISRNGKTRPRAVLPGPPDDEPPISEESGDGNHRRIVLTPASDINRAAWNGSGMAGLR